jgi:succinate dehydrogenase / fumarate reductase flavoprotein subunit
MALPGLERQQSTSVLVIGAGGAGLRAAIEVAQRGVQVLVVAKRSRQDAHTVLAAGGINAALGTMDPEDSAEQHAADTLAEGYWLGHPRIVDQLVDGAPQAIAELEAWGARFHHEEDGRLSQRFFGAHTWRRTCFAGDYTGREMQMALVRRATQLPIDVNDRLVVTRLLEADGRVFGAYGFDIETGAPHVVYADAVILATGGHTRIYRRSSSRRDENLGEGMRLALKAGGRLQDMELVQFHPTGMVAPEAAAGTLVTEAVRGEGGILTNALGERYMERYDPERRELSTRDRVALANYTEIHEGRGTANGGVLLDITHLPRELVLDRLPRMYRQFLDLAMLDITTTPMEVAPTAHYSMGGIAVDPDTHAVEGLEGLWAVGECAAGLHGANRLGGNSLAEIVVFGRHVGEHAAATAQALSAQVRDPGALRGAREEVEEVLGRRGTEFARPLQRAVRDLMWESAGVVRDRARLEDGLRRLDDVRSAMDGLEVRPDMAGYDDVAHAFDLAAMVDTAQATLLGALAREESRGCHQRSDFPETDDALRVNLTVADDGIVAQREIPGTDPALVAMSGELAVAGRLLE